MIKNIRNGSYCFGFFCALIFLSQDITQGKYKQIVDLRKWPPERVNLFIT